MTGARAVNPLRVLITGPALRDEGGVANYYNAVLRHLTADPRVAVEYFELGSTKGSMGPLHPVADQAGFHRMLGRFQPDLVHVNPSLTLKSFFRDGLLVDQARRRRIPTVVFFRGWDRGTEARVDRELGWLFRRTFGRANGFIVLGSRFRDKLVEWGVQVPITLETTTVPDAVIRSFVLEEKLQRIRNDHPLRILFLARLERDKGVLETVQAVELLRGRGVDVSLTVAGDGPAMADVRRAVAAHAGLAGRVEVVGYVRGEAKRALFMSHHVYCFPSEYKEGMPNSVLEAMALGMPIVTCPVGGLADFFEDGRMGWLVPGRDAARVAAKLESLARDRAAAAAMAAHNHSYAVRRFLAPDVARRLGEIYLSTARAERAVRAVPLGAGGR
jgi:glycosyltransferase involved in cell wall biosynthesis